MKLPAPRQTLECPPNALLASSPPLGYHAICVNAGSLRLERLVWDGQEAAGSNPVAPISILPEIQSVFRPKFPLLVDDIGNLAFLGKLRSIRKSDDMPADYFASESDDTLRDNFQILDCGLLASGRFEEFVRVRRELIATRVRNALGR